MVDMAVAALSTPLVPRRSYAAPRMRTRPTPRRRVSAGRDALARCGSQAQFAVFSFSASSEALENLAPALSVMFITRMGTRRSEH